MLPGFLNSIAIAVLNFALTVSLLVMVRRAVREERRYIPPYAPQVD